MKDWIGFFIVAKPYYVLETGTYKEIVMTMGAVHPAHSRHIWNRCRGLGLRRGQTYHPLTIGPRTGNALEDKKNMKPKLKKNGSSTNKITK